MGGYETVGDGFSGGSPSCNRRRLVPDRVRANAMFVDYTSSGTWFVLIYLVELRPVDTE